MNLKSLIVIVVIINFIGCSSKEKINVDTTPKLQIAKKIEPAVQKKGALYSRRGASLFSDKKDLQIGDIVQVLISETVENESSNSRTTGRSSGANIGGGLFSSSGTTSSGTQSKIDKLNGVLGIGFNAESSSSFKGSAASSVDEEFTTTVSAIIEQTYQNGNYFIKGSKEMLINGQKQTIRISGVIRPYDISPENTVYSSQLANLKILFNQDGDETDSTKKAWGSKVLEVISPF
ncbi:MAG: flagellar basal body L-ring protein FlgH [Campylobacterota bacterium]|nr:flagellar basal body L-ring protein FlgH [Campylobacterota bacterium]